MNYIYDIVLNFQDNYYQFFEWKRTDKIKNIKKIPIYRVVDYDLNTLKNNNTKIDLTTLKIQSKNSPIPILVSNTKTTLGLLISKDGTILKKSSLLFEEEDEANLISTKLEITKINYLYNKEKNLLNKLRLEIEKKDVLINYIKQEKDDIKLKYLYYEYFKEEECNIDYIKKTLIKELKKTWTNKQNNLYHLFKYINKDNQLT